MSDSVIIIAILLILLAGVSAVGLSRLFFKKSIVFNVVAILTLPILSAVVMGLIVGARGLAHLIWAVPSAVTLILGAYGIIAKQLQGPLNEMLDKVDSLAEGDVHISFTEKYQKGGTELAKVMRRLVKLTGSLKNIVEFANHIGQGELDTQYELLGEKDTLGKSMLNMQHNLQEAEVEKEKRQQEDERRNWVTVGLAKFAELLRENNDNIEELCHSIISNMVNYIGSNQAGFFFLNDDDPGHQVLELKACYAYERRKFLEKTIEPGEGLVGTCFLERESIYMTQVPKDYIHITSGLGDDAPRALLITPLKVNEEIYGILEIAAFKEFEPHVREFVEKVAESIASTIGSVKVNIRTNKLLDLSKVQAEEMASQEEELRQNMEEMQATQEEMSRKQREAGQAYDQLASTNKQLETQLQDLEKAVPLLALSPDAVIIDASDSFLSLLHHSKDQMIDQPVTEFIVSGEKDIEKIFRKIMSGGRAHSGELTLVAQNGEKVVSYLATPVYKMQEIEKIILVCISIQ